MPLTPGQDVYVSFSAEISPATTESLLGVCADLVNARIGRLYLLLSTPGGNVMNGLNIYNVLRGLPFKVVTHNVGNVDSIGNVVFLAGEERYSAPHATFMFHGVGFDIPAATRLEEKLLKERLDSIKADQERIGSVIAARSTLKPNEISRLFLQAKTRDPGYALTHGIVHDIRDAQVPNGATMLQLVFKR